MAKTTQSKKRHTSSDLKKLFGPQFRLPTDEEMLSTKPIELNAILAELKQQHREKKRTSTHELAQVRKELQKLLSRLAKIEKNLIAP